MVNLSLSWEDHRLILAISERAAGYYEGEEARDVLDIAMDLAAVHTNGCPLRLSEMEAGDSSDLMHDVEGIRRHLDRVTGHLENNFVPRYAKG